MRLAPWLVGGVTNEIVVLRYTLTSLFLFYLQSGASSLAKQGGAYFSAVCGSIQDPIAAPGPHETQEP